mmetsp:Transcript_32922/g.80012  ORF Transcript_32922/g.80012 Transcript_32922/m.80012 type:complete len:92 (-) Transcript_32922:271-546(-)
MGRSSLWSAFKRRRACWLGSRRVRSVMSLLLTAQWTSGLSAMENRAINHLDLFLTYFLELSISSPSMTCTVAATGVLLELFFTIGIAHRES